MQRNNERHPFSRRGSYYNLWTGRITALVRQASHWGFNLTPEYRFFCIARITARICCDRSRHKP